MQDKPRRPSWRTGYRARRSRHDPKQSPDPRHAFQLALSPILELNTRADDERWRHHGNEHLTGASQIADAFGDGHRQPDHIVGPNFHLSDVDTGPNLQSHPFRRSRDLTRGPYRPGGGVKRGKEPVAGGLDLSPPVTLKGASDHGVVGV